MERNGCAGLLLEELDGKMLTPAEAYRINIAYHYYLDPPTKKGFDSKGKIQGHRLARFGR